jgi:hypothetical protein
MKFTKFLLLFLLFHIQLHGQVNQLSFYADVMANASLAQHRIYAEEQFSTILSQELQKEGMDLTFLDQIKGISNLSLEKYNAKLLTWQYKIDEVTYRHFGMIIDSQKRITHLFDQSNKNGDQSYEILNHNDWHGAYYYDMMFDSTGQYYILFGFNGAKTDYYEKLADVLYQDENKSWKFGKEIFLQKEDESRPDIKTRISVQYSPSSVVTCRYDKDSQLIIHDYTITAANDFDGKLIGKVPDGTYVAYERKNELWKMIEKLENTKIEEMKPDFKAKRDVDSPDILGRSNTKTTPGKKRNQVKKQSD